MLIRVCEEGLYQFAEMLLKHGARVSKRIPFMCFSYKPVNLVLFSDTLSQIRGRGKRESGKNHGNMSFTLSTIFPTVTTISMEDA